MKTTDSRTPRVLTRAAAIAAASVAALAVAGAAVGGPSAASGAAVGGAVAVGVFVFGTSAVDAVARLMPAASLMFALVTYTFQVAVLALVFVALTRSGLLDSELDRDWLGGAIVLSAIVWIVVQVRLATTARIPAYDIAGEQSVNTLSRGAGPAAEGGAR